MGNIYISVNITHNSNKNAIPPPTTTAVQPTTTYGSKVILILPTTCAWIVLTVVPATGVFWSTISMLNLDGGNVIQKHPNPATVAVRGSTKIVWVPATYICQGNITTLLIHLI